MRQVLLLCYGAVRLARPPLLYLDDPSLHQYDYIMLENGSALVSIPYPNVPQTNNAMQIRKLTYLQMLGYDMSWAAFYVIEVSVSSCLLAWFRRAFSSGYSSRLSAIQQSVHGRGSVMSPPSPPSPSAQARAVAITG